MKLFGNCRGPDKRGGEGYYRMAALEQKRGRGWRGRNRLLTPFPPLPQGRRKWLLNRIREKDRERKKCAYVSCARFTKCPSIFEPNFDNINSSVWLLNRNHFIPLSYFSHLECYFRTDMSGGRGPLWPTLEGQPFSPFFFPLDDLNCRSIYRVLMFNKTQRVL